MSLNLKISHKILIFWFVSVLLALILVALISSHMTQSLHEDNTRKQIADGFQSLYSQIQSRKTHLIHSAKILANRKDIVASVSMILTYQDIRNYRPIIFDVEKQKLSRILATQLRLDELNLIRIYDVNLTPLAYVTKNVVTDNFVTENSGTIELGIQSWENGQRQLLITDETSNDYLKSDDLPSIMDSDIIDSEDLVPGSHLRAFGDDLLLEVTYPVVRKKRSGKESAIGFIKMTERISARLLKSNNLRTNLNFSMLLPDSNHSSETDEVLNRAFGQALPVESDANDYNNWLFYSKPGDYSGVLIQKIEDDKTVKFYFTANKESLSAEIEIFQRAMILSLLLIALFLIPAGIIFLRRNISMPISELVAGVSALERGRYEELSVSERRDEFGFFAISFDRMAAVIDDRETALRKSEEKTRLILDSVAEGIYGIDERGLCSFANPACLELLGYSNDAELIGRNMHELIHHTDASGDPLLREDCRVNHVFKTGNGEHCDYEVFWCKNGKSFFSEYWAHPVYQNSVIVGVVVAFFDISKRKMAEAELAQHRHHLEKLVAERTAELEASNKEMEAFCYSVSHDLRAPLRGIDGLSHVLEEDYQNEIDETGKDYISRIRKATHRMSDLIDDLLNLSRISRYDLIKKEVNLSELAFEIFGQIQAEQPERRVEFKVKSGLVVNGDPSLLKIAFENLLGNAWKYSANVEFAAIEFDEELVNGKNVFVVRDNGAGFNMEYVDKIFGAFQRLHGDEYEGTGIGLATVQRIVQRHGGSIWGEGKVGEGACFYFTL
ncbi:MAG: ATP-binding protein [Gammaproteobacteria bacterium]|nr:ATP-binding protein [Gammaproteobacteria bacterium]